MYHITNCKRWQHCLHVCQFFIQACYARVLDYRRKFIEAAQRYHELSFKTAVDEAQRQAALEKTLICTILASAGKLWYYSRRHTMQYKYHVVGVVVPPYLAWHM